MLWPIGIISRWRSLGEYQDRYLQTDVILLSDVFETFWETCLRELWIRSCAILHQPRISLAEPVWKRRVFSWNYYLIRICSWWFKRGIRGGITQAVHRYARANNKYMEDKYDPEKENSFLQYLDTNNLYGWAMVQKLSTGGFNWVKDAERFTCAKNQ